MVCTTSLSHGYVFFNISKSAIFCFLGFHATGEAFSPQKRKSRASKQEIPSLFSIVVALWVILPSRWSGSSQPKSIIHADPGSTTLCITVCNKQKMKKIFFCCCRLEGHWRKKQAPDPVPNPDPQHWWTCILFSFIRFSVFQLSWYLRGSQNETWCCFHHGEQSAAVSWPFRQDWKKNRWLVFTILSNRLRSSLRLEVSERISPTIGKGGTVFYQVFLLSPLQVYCTNCKRSREFDE